MALEPTGGGPFQAGVSSHTAEHRLESSGYRLVLGEGAEARDVSPSVSNLRYSSRLPGGFADCTFTLGLSVREAAWLKGGTRCRVFYRGALAWDGAVQEGGIGEHGVRSLPVTALGHGAKMRDRRWSRLFIEHGYGRWRAGAEVARSHPPEANDAGTSSLLPGIPETLNQVGIWVTMAQGSVWDTTTGRYGITYTAPPGTEILRVVGSYAMVHAASTYLGLGAWEADEEPGWGLSGEEGVASANGTASGTYDDTLADPAKYLTLRQVPLGGGSAPSLYYLGIYDHFVIGARDADGAVFSTTNVTSYRALQSLIEDYGGDVWLDPLTCPPIHPYTGFGWDDSDAVAVNLDPQHAWTDLLFEDATLEEAIDRLNGPVGWEWGVFEDGRLYWAPLETITTSARSEDGEFPVTVPQWWYQARSSDGWAMSLSRSTVDAVNGVRVRYTDSQGQPQVEVVSDYANPGNPLNDPGNPLEPRVRRDAMRDIGAATQAEALAVGQAFLRQYGRVQVKGTAVVNAPRVSRGASHDDRNEWAWAPCIRPGQWVLAADADVNPAIAGVTAGGVLSQQQGRYVPLGQLLPIRSVEVAADSGTVTLNVDTARDTFGAMMARLSRGIA